MAPPPRASGCDFDGARAPKSISVIAERPAGDSSRVSLDTPVSPIPSGLALPPVANEPRRAEAFVREHHPFVWRVLRRSGLSPADADDAAQRVFLIAVARLDTIAQGSERAFLYRAAARVASNAHRSVRRRRETPGLEGAEEPDGLPMPDDLLDQRRARALLDRVLGELPEDLRAIIILFELEGLRTPEIAEALGIPAGTVSSRLRRARAEVEQRVARYRNPRRTREGLP
jgi:RNA polymerase sigma-70 factor (ECF subfamily)